MDVIKKLIHDEKKQAMYEEESLADMLFDKEDLLESEGGKANGIRRNFKRTWFRNTIR